MKRLLVMRHGETQDVVTDDKSRALTRKGRADMQLLHAQLLAVGLMPEFALASDAVRTKTTLQEVTGADFTGTRAFSPALYNARAERLLGEARQIDDQYNTALIVAHNPGIYELVIELVRRQEQGGLIKKLGNNYKSGTLTAFECPIESWSALTPGHNSVMQVFIPQ